MEKLKHGIKIGDQVVFDLESIFLRRKCFHLACLAGRRLFFRGTHKVRDELQLSHFVG